MGAGAVGGYFGGLLARAGVEVQLVARGAHLQALQQRGLRVRTRHGEFTVQVPATDDPARVGPVDLVLFCVKSYQTQQAARACVPMLGERTCVLVLQNGVDNEEKVAAEVGAARVVPGVAYVGVEVNEPGVVEHHDRGELWIGEWDGQFTPRVQAIAGLFQQAGVPCEVASDIRTRKWQKFLFNCALNALTTLTGQRLPALMAHEPTRELFRQAVAEAAAVARRHGVPLAADAEEQVMATASRMDIASSMLSDRRRGRPLEVDAFNGVVVQLGRRYRVPTPVNEVLYALLKAIDPAASPAADQSFSGGAAPWPVSPGS